MCGGLEFQKRNGEPVRVLFPNPKAALLVDQALNRWLPWGRRKEEPGDWPEGGWARYESLNKGYWRRWGSERALVWPVRWMEKDRQRKSHWFDMPPGHALVGLVLTKAPGTPIYVVTSQADGGYLADIHDRIPKLVPVAAALEAHRIARMGGESVQMEETEKPSGGDPNFGIYLENALLALSTDRTRDWTEPDVRKWFREEFVVRFPEWANQVAEDAAASLAFTQQLAGPGRFGAYWNLRSSASHEPAAQTSPTPQSTPPLKARQRHEAIPLPLDE